MRYALNYSGTRFLSTDYSISWWIPSECFCSLDYKQTEINISKTRSLTENKSQVTLDIDVLGDIQSKLYAISSLILLFSGSVYNEGSTVNYVDGIRWFISCGGSLQSDSEGNKLNL